MVTDNQTKNVSVFKGFNEVVETKPITEILASIKRPKFTGPFENIRSLYQEGKKKEGDELKKMLSGFTVSGEFRGGRRLENLVKYSGYIVLDLDNLNAESLPALKAVVSNDPHTFACFISPSGLGIKIIVSVDTEANDHERAYNIVADYYEQLTKVPFDRSGKDVVRLCFNSYDPDLYFNEQAAVFSIPSVQAFEAEYRRCIILTDNKSSYQEGNRNNYVHLLACNCNRLGIPENIATKYLMAEYCYDEKEVSKTIESAYQNNAGEFAHFAHFVQPLNQGEPVRSAVTPVIPQEVYNNLPALLKRGCDVFTVERERDIYLTGALTVLSGCFHNLSGVYDGREVYPNLFSIVVAGAASGKGTLVFAKQLGMAYHKSMLTASKNNPTAGQARKVLYIPADSSSAAVIKMLEDCNGRGIICETEADTLNNSLKQDWGGYSDLLRKAFQHEPVSYNRKTNNEYLEIPEPKLSISLSGTPAQVQQLIPSAENGLFSRFLFYAFSVPKVWKDVSPDGKPNLTKHFKALSDDVLNILGVVNATEITFEFTANQWSEFNKDFSKRLTKIQQLGECDAESSVVRLGLIAYRIAMLLTVLRGAQDNTISENIVCSELDFKSAMMLSEVYLEHILYMVSKLPKAANLEPNHARFYGALPNEFTRAEAVKIGEQKGIEATTVDKYLRVLTDDSKLKKIAEKYGSYKKK